MDALSFNNDPALKAEHVAQAEHHAAQDMLLSGTYARTVGGNFRGCSVGCFAHEISPGLEDVDPHETVSTARHLPEWLIRLQDTLFEGLPSGERPTFHVELAKRIPVGVDLEPVKHWIAIDRIDRMLVTQRAALEAKHPIGVHEAIAQTVAALEVMRRTHEAMAKSESCDVEAARSAAESAAESAWSAARSAAESAWSAAWSAWSAARSAWSAARSAESAARSAAWSAESAAESAWSAARSAESAARSAAWSAESAAESAYREERDALFRALDRAGRQ